jgi:glycine dehydrogenase subunit 2
MMVEPTECESKETLDSFISAMREIAELTESAPEQLQATPVTTPVCRPDELWAAKEMDLSE